MKRIITNSKYVVVLLMLVYKMPSCTDWLSLVPENDLIKEKFWKKKDDADGALAAAYDAFREASLESCIGGELRGDMIVIGGTNFAE